MSGRNRLPGGEKRKASQKRSRPAEVPTIQLAEVPWRPGDRVRWRDRSGTYRRDTGDGEHAEVTIGERIYRVRRAELRQG
jgi:hypothetical protein